MALNNKNKMIRTYFCGLAMGAADVVPGVSGGTIAFITGIYKELLQAIASVDMQFFKYLFSFKIKQAFAKIPFAFLLPLLLGILTAIISFAKVIVFLLANYPLFVWTFFLGLILASAYMLYSELPKKNLQSFVIFVLGFVFAYFLSGLETQVAMPNTPLYIFLAGAIAICAMILPGISGSFLLVILGKYEFILSAIANFDFETIVFFAMGAVCGILAFVRVLNFALKHFYSLTLALLTGVMLGSVKRILLSLPSVEMNIDLVFAAACLVLGLALPLLLQKVANTKK